MAKKKDTDASEVEINTTPEVVTDSTPSVVDSVPAPKETKKKAKVPKPLSIAATKWQAYLKQMNWTAEFYLSRYPDHKYRETIEELLAYEKK